jgi:hypothetical protein
MLFKVAVVLLAVWVLARLVDALGVYPVGDVAHVFLLAGGMLLLLAVVKGREAALRAPKPAAED